MSQGGVGCGLFFSLLSLCGLAWGKRWGWVTFFETLASSEEIVA
jgi:hypothetical protein